MKKCNPLQPPDPLIWKSLDEDERVRLVRAFHERKRFAAGSVELHYLLHVIVENQAAERDELPIRRTLTRLMSEGVDRHEAIHAVASVLAERIFDITKGVIPTDDINAEYFADLERLTVASWRAHFADDEAE